MLRKIVLKESKIISSEFVSSSIDIERHLHWMHDTYVCEIMCAKVLRHLTELA